ncbi:MAG: hypothetical protein IKI32_06480 [Lachnospiraceae bacterium]|nr:hypothetical protein [Lachnospiraceae bacterium]MBR7076555.1 hypothetical protein [Lachnospiraceae bacterium]
MYKCPHCGGELDYLPGTEIIKCEYCGSEFSASELIEEKEVTAAEYQEKQADESKNERGEKTIEATIFTCPQCGGEIYSLDQSAVTFCSYCGSQVTLQSRLSRIRKPDVVIPFKLTAEQGMQEYFRKVKHSLFVPSEMKKDSEVEKLRGIYMPYWVYNVKAPEKIKVSSSVEHRTVNYIVKDHYATTITAEGTIDGIAYDAASAFSDELSGGIAPYDFREAKDFAPGYFSSFYADEGDVESYLYKDEAFNVAADAYAENVYHPDMKKYGLDKQKISKEFISDGMERKLGYYPVWFLANKNKKGNRVSYATINGQTGKAAVDLPVDFTKYLIASLIIAVPIFVLLTLFLTMTPRTLGFVVMALSIIAVIFANLKLNEVYTRKGMFDDLGLSSKNPAAEKKVMAEMAKRRKESTRVKDVPSMGSVIGSTFFMAIFILGVIFFVTGSAGIAILGFLVILLARIVWNLIQRRRPRPSRKIIVAAPMKEKIGTLWKCLAAFVIVGVVAIIFPVNDIYFYIADIIAILLTGWTVLDIVRSHNLLTMRKLPQFGKRGGDEHEY